MDMMARRALEGWILIAGAALIGVALTTAALASADTGEAGLRVGLRLTARESYALFLLVFAAAPLHATWRSWPSRWLRRNRRALGLALAAAMAVHLVLIVALAAMHPASFAAGLAPTTAIGGGFGLVMIALMTATSFDRPAAALGRRRWKVLHTTGIWTLFAIFGSTYGGLATVEPRYAVVVAPLLALVALRVAVRASASARASGPAPRG